MLGIQNLTIDGIGYVYWKGVNVEYYSHDTEAEMLETARWLEQRCLHLEALGVAVNGNTATWFSDWFAGLTPEDFDNGIVDRTFLSRPPGFYESDDGRRAVLWSGYLEGKPDGTYVSGGRALEWDGNQWAEIAIESFKWNFDLAHPWEYHGLVARGYHIARMGQGEMNGVCYATTDGLLDLLHRWQIPGAGIGRPWEAT